MPISAAFSTCSGVPPSTSAQSPPAAIAHAEPTSPWQPTSAPEIEALVLNRMPIAAAVSRKPHHAVVVGAGDEPRSSAARPA